jgi:UPF0755 protein
MDRVRKIIRFLFTIFLIFALAFFFFIYSITASMVKPGGRRIFTVRSGESARTIAGELRKEGLILNALAFRILVRVSRSETRIKAGDYEITPNMNTINILQKIVRGDVIKRIFTVPEGSSIDDIARILGDDLLISPEEFLGVARNNTFPIGDETPASLEGYLYPDTYQIAQKASARDIAGVMVARFNEIVLPEYEKFPRRKSLTLGRIIIIASLVEKEARLEGERPVIAGVYFNRLDNGIPLQCDATIQFILGSPKPLLTYADLKIPSPYNTYLNSGLPPGPICSPGLASIRAALKPAKVKYLYYVVNELRNDGSHIFSISLKEHERAIERYQKKTGR